MKHTPIEHIMKKILLATILIMISYGLFAQVSPRKPAALPPPLPTREVSGIVKDEKGETVIGANITLTSKTDTVRTATNNDGIFVLHGVRSATFVLTIAELGYISSTRKYLNSDIAKRIVLDPIILKTQSNMLNEVVINGTPSITYKTDTVEYRASDYKVRENATVDELLKKMEGMEVGSDGTLTHQGQQVTKARLNGKDYAGGDVAQAIQNLPADIVEKIQVVDDYGDQAGRTGIKDGDPTKVLNITTKANRSVGNIARITASGGSDDRYDERIFAQRINANEQLGIIGNIANTVNGVASTGLDNGLAGSSGGRGSNLGNGGGSGNSTSGGSGGTTTSGGPSFNYRDQWSKSVQVNANYRYGFRDVYSVNNSVAQQFSTLGTTFVNNQNSGHNNSKTHSGSFELEYMPDSANFLRVTPSLSYSGGNTDNNSQITQTGLQNQYLNGNTSSTSSAPTIGAIVLYQHIFKKPRRNISLQINYNHADSHKDNLQNNEIQYRDINQELIKDSLIHRQVIRSSLTKNYRASLQYVEPLGQLSQLEFNAQVNYNGYDNDAYTSNLDNSGNKFLIDSLSNVYNYAFTTGRITGNYRLNKKKFNLSLGATAIPSHLDGTNISKGTTTSRNDFYLVPMFRFQYVWSRQERLSINYTGTPTEPTFNQIQPVPDYSNPQNPVFGNPDLKPSFRHTITSIYNNYISNSKLNLSATVAASVIENQVVSNTVQVQQPGLKSLLNETYYTNLNGNYNITGNYNIAKQLDDRKYNLSLNGTVSYGHAVAMSNGVQNYVSSWRINERFGPRIDPDSWYEVNPYVSYDINKSTNTLPGAFNSDIRTAALAIDGRFFFLKTWRLGYSASKNYITGINSNITKNPLVVNAYFEKEFFAKKNGILRVSAFDLFNQNNFVNRVITQNSITDTKTNALSRYFLVSFVLNLQKWSGTATRKGRALQRRGDGSFIY